MNKSIVAVFETQSVAKEALEVLARAGLPRHAMHLSRPSKLSTPAYRGYLLTDSMHLSPSARTVFKQLFNAAETGLRYRGTADPGHHLLKVSIDSPKDARLIEDLVAAYDPVHISRCVCCCSG